MFLTTDNYYSQEANQKYMSVSQFKAFRKCEAAALAELNGEWESESTQALLLGSFVDAFFEGTLADFLDKHPEVFKKSGELKADFDQAQKACLDAVQDKMFVDFMTGKKQVIKTKTLFGCDWKIRMDVYVPEKRIVDLKYMRSMDRVMGKSFVEHWGYDLQLAVYDAVCDDGDIDTYLAVLTKEEPADKGIIDVPAWRREEMLKEVERDLPRILDVKSGKVPPRRCEHCAYCRATKKLTEIIDFELVGLTQEQIAAITGGTY